MFILKQFECEKLHWGEAVCLAIDALERIKEDKIVCGGRIVFATLDPKMLDEPAAALFDGEIVDRTVKKLMVVREKNDIRYKNELGKVMKQIHQEDFKNLLKEIESKKGLKSEEIQKIIKNFTGVSTQMV